MRVWGFEFGVSWFREEGLRFGDKGEGLELLFFYFPTLTPRVE